MLTHRFYIAVHDPAWLKVNCYNAVEGDPNSLVQFSRRFEVVQSPGTFRLEHSKNREMLFKDIGSAGDRSAHFHFIVTVTNSSRIQGALTGFDVSIQSRNPGSASGWYRLLNERRREAQFHSENGTLAGHGTHYNDQDVRVNETDDLKLFGLDDALTQRDEQ